MPTIEERALALVNEICEERGEITYGSISRTGKNIAGNEALCRALETLDAERAAHAQFRQEVSDAVEAYCLKVIPYGNLEWQRLACLIIAKPDPLVEVQNLLDDGLTLEEAIVNLGLKLVEVGDAD